MAGGPDCLQLWLIPQFQDDVLIALHLGNRTEDSPLRDLKEGLTWLDHQLKETMVEAQKNITLTPGETQTYMHLGIIVANTGYRSTIYGIRQQIAKGNRDPSNDLGAWFAQQGFSDEELSELYRFRGSLVHGMVTLKPNGEVDIVDKEDGQRTYTSDEIRQYAGRFFSLRMENRTTLTASFQNICQCGGVFPTPESDEELREHLKTCPVYNRWLNAQSP